MFDSFFSLLSLPIMQQLLAFSITHVLHCVAPSLLSHVFLLLFILENKKIAIVRFIEIKGCVGIRP